ncbi:hypothetical protein DMJ13_00555 [halophilic archaeon]|nr:hypothetical protein DMJ13_00555 [halophilic archaeon]
MSHVDRSPRRLRQALDVVVYSVAVTGVVFAFGAVVSFAVGAGLVGVKYTLFLVGLLLFGYGTLQLRPKRPWDVTKTDDEVEIVRRDGEENKRSIGSREETAFQSAVQRIPPLSHYSIPPEERLPPGVKLFVSSLAVLGTSFVMEAAFGVGV